MKKLLAILTVVALLMSVCSMSLFTAQAVTKNVVGSKGATNTAEDGITIADFNAAHSQQMEVSFTLGALVHRYAVDVIFDSTNGAFTFNTGAYQWNVNTFQYEAVTTTMLPTTTDFTVTVNNYSDMAVNVVAEIQDPYPKLTEAGIVFEMDGGDENGQVKFPLAAVAPGAGAPSTNSTTVSLDVADPTATMTFLKNDAGAATSVLLGKITVTVSPATP